MNLINFIEKLFTIRSTKNILYIHLVLGLSILRKKKVDLGFSVIVSIEETILLKTIIAIFRSIKYYVY